MKKNYIPRIVSAAAALMLVFTTGCGSGSSDTALSETEAQTAAPAAADDSLQKILDKGELILGSDAAFPPLGFFDASGNTVGFDIEVAEEVCSRLNIKLTVKTIDWDEKDTELNSGAIDCIWDGMSYTAERAEDMCLSEPYLNNSIIFVVSSLSQTYSADDLDGASVGVQAGSTSEEILGTLGMNITAVPYDTMDGVLDSLAEGETKAALMDSVVANYLASTGERKLMFLPETYAEEEYVVGFRKDDVSLRNEVQNILRDMKEDGTLAEISKKWFGADITIVK